MANLAVPLFFPDLPRRTALAKLAINVSANHLKGAIAAIPHTPVLGQLPAQVRVFLRHARQFQLLYSAIRVQSRGEELFKSGNLIGSQ